MVLRGRLLAVTVSVMMAVAIALAMGLACMVPGWQNVALADASGSVQVAAVAASATIEADGTLSVSEERLCFADKNSDSVSFVIPAHALEGQDITVEIVSAGIVTSEKVPYELVPAEEGPAVIEAIRAEVAKYRDKYSYYDPTSKSRTSSASGTSDAAGASSASVASGASSATSASGASSASSASSSFSASSASGSAGSSGSAGDSSDSGVSGYNVLKYSVSDGDEGAKVVTFYWLSAAGKQNYYVDYRVSGAVAAWADCAELRWSYAGAPKDSTMGNIDFTFAFAQEGASGDLSQVQSWNHEGTLTGTSEAKGASLLVHAPLLQPGEYADAHVVFPAEWVPSAPVSDEARLDAVYAEEARLADAASGKLAAEGRSAEGVDTSIPESEVSSATMSRITSTSIFVYGIWAVIVIVMALAVYWRIQYHRNHKAQFTGKYWKGPPSADHPAVLDYVWDGENGGCEAMAVTLMRLERLGAITMEQSTTMLDIGTGVGFVMTVVPEKAGSLDDPIDRAAIEFLESVHRNMSDMREEERRRDALAQARAQASQGPRAAVSVSRYEPPDDSEPDIVQVSFDDIVVYSKEKRESFLADVRKWDDVVKGAVAARGLDDDRTYRSQFLVSSYQKYQEEKRYRVDDPLKQAGGALLTLLRAFLRPLLFFSFAIIGSLLAVFVALHEAVTSPLMVSHGLTVPLMLLPFGILGCIVLAPMQFRTRAKLSGEAVELRAKLYALRTWLTDLPAEGGPPPNDDATWADLMELAVVLRVSNRAGAVMMETVPDVKNAPELQASRRWCVNGEGLVKAPALESFAKAYKKAMEV